ncbi:MAG TPA: AAA family ATPase [Ktedonobacteraceae bacterium]|nr:AAA family ATPase [Ktedonobacteraceae bacterium]
MQAPFADPLSGIELTSRPLPLAGREGEMQLICNLLDTVEFQRTYGARALIMSGETGTGKTRLLAEMCQEASKRGFYLLEGRAYEVSKFFPYMPFTEALRPVIRASRVKTLRYLVGLDTIESASNSPDTADSDVSISLVGAPMVAALARLFPELPHLLKLDLEPELLAPDQEKFRLLDAIATLLERMATTQTVMLSIDNLQWADSASLELMMYLTVRLHGSRVALVGVTRPPASPPSIDDEDSSSVETERMATTTLQLLSELMRQGLLLFLPISPLNREGAMQHLRALLPGAIAGEEVLLERAGGNPFFLEELVRMLTLNGQLAQHNGIWDVTKASAAELPASIALAVRERLEIVSKPCLEALRVAALFGRSFPQAALTMVTEESETWVQARLNEAERALIIALAPRQTSLGEDEDDLADDNVVSNAAAYLFCQSIVQEVLSSQVPVQRASLLHGKIGAALEAYYDAQGLQPPAAQLARHYVLSGERKAALRWSLRAGEEASGQQAHREAIGHFRSALKLMKSNLSLTGEDGLPSLAQVYVQIGESWFKIGELNAAAKAFLKALEQLQQQPSSSSQRHYHSRAWLAAQANRMLADAYRMQGKYELTLAHLQAARSALDSSVDETDEAVAPTRKEHHYTWMTSRGFSGQKHRSAGRLLNAERILLLQAQATLDLLIGRSEESERGLWQSYQLATELGDRGSQAFALHVVSWIRGWGTHIHEAIRLQSQAHDLYIAMGDPFRAVLGDQGLGIIYQALGETEKARLHNMRGFEMARRYGVRHALGWLHWNMGVMALAEGNWAECESRMQQSMQEAEATSNERLKPIIIQVQAELAFRKGEWQAAEQLFRASSVAAMNTEWYPSTLALYGHFLAVTGRKAEAKAQLEQAAALQEPVGYSGHYYIPFLAEGFLHIGAPVQATGYIERIQKLRGFMYYGVAVDRIRGEVAALNGEWDAAEQAFEDGLGLCRRVGNQPEEAAILYEQTRTILMQAGQQNTFASRALETIQHLCQTAHDIFIQYEMRRAVSMVDTLQEGLRQLNARKTPVPPHKIVEEHFAHEDYILDLHLTRRELDVLRLVAEGQTDREVAEALVISPRTVNRHLSNIFVKLDVPGRAAAVAYAIRQGLVG